MILKSALKFSPLLAPTDEVHVAFIPPPDNPPPTLHVPRVEKKTTKKKTTWIARSIPATTSRYWGAGFKYVSRSS